MQDQDDEVVASWPVYLTQDLANSLYLLKFPLRDRDRPYESDFGPMRRVDFKPINRQVEVQFGEDQNQDERKSSAHPVSDPVISSAPDPVKRSGLRLVSQFVPAKTNYAVGVVHDGQLHLTPVRGIYRMVPDIPDTPADSSEGKASEGTTGSVPGSLVAVGAQVSMGGGARIHKSAASGVVTSLPQSFGGSGGFGTSTFLQRHACEAFVRMPVCQSTATTATVMERLWAEFSVAGKESGRGSPTSARRAVKRIPFTLTHDELLRYMAVGSGGPQGDGLTQWAGRSRQAALLAGYLNRSLATQRSLPHSDSPEPAHAPEPALVWRWVALDDDSSEGSEGGAVVGIHGYRAAQGKGAWPQHAGLIVQGSLVCLDPTGAPTVTAVPQAITGDVRSLVARCVRDVVRRIFKTLYHPASRRHASKDRRGGRGAQQAASTAFALPPKFSLETSRTLPFVRLATYSEGWEELLTSLGVRTDVYQRRLRSAARAFQQWGGWERWSRSWPDQAGLPAWWPASPADRVPLALDPLCELHVLLLNCMASVAVGLDGVYCPFVRSLWSGTTPPTKHYSADFEPASRCGCGSGCAMTVGPWAGLGPDPVPERKSVRGGDQQSAPDMDLAVSPVWAVSAGRVLADNSDSRPTGGGLPPMGPSGAATRDDPMLTASMEDEQDREAPALRVRAPGVRERVVTHAQLRDTAQPPHSDSNPGRALADKWHVLFAQFAPRVPVVRARPAAESAAVWSAQPASSLNEPPPPSGWCRSRAGDPGTLVRLQRRAHAPADGQGETLAAVYPGRSGGGHAQAGHWESANQAAAMYLQLWLFARTAGHVGTFQCATCGCTRGRRQTQSQPGTRESVVPFHLGVSGVSTSSCSAATGELQCACEHPVSSVSRDWLLQPLLEWGVVGCDLLSWSEVNAALCAVLRELSGPGFGRGKRYRLALSPQYQQRWLAPGYSRVQEAVVAQLERFSGCWLRRLARWWRLQSGGDRKETKPVVSSTTASRVNLSHVSHDTEQLAASYVQLRAQWRESAVSGRGLAAPSAPLPSSAGDVVMGAGSGSAVSWSGGGSSLGGGGSSPPQSASRLGSRLVKTEAKGQSPAVKMEGVQMDRTGGSALGQSRTSEPTPLPVDAPQAVKSRDDRLVSAVASACFPPSAPVQRTRKVLGTAQAVALQQTGLGQVAPAVVQSLVSRAGYEVRPGLWVTRSVAHPALNRVRSVVLGVFRSLPSGDTPVRKGDVAQACRREGISLPQHLYAKAMRTVARSVKSAWYLQNPTESS